MTILSPFDLPVLNILDKKTQEKILAELSGFIIDNVRQEAVRRIFLEEMSRGLSDEPERPSSLLMENTFIEELIDGTEEGNYLALDLGGTNLRVLRLELKEGKIVNQDIESYDVPDYIRTGTGVALFDYLAGCIEHFWDKMELPDENFKLGFTFSFCMTQKAVDSGILNCWTKTYNCSGVVGNDAVQMLKDAIAKRPKLNVTVNSVLNDATGTLVKGSYLDHRCAIGMIIGTGSNICYLEKVPNIKKWKGQHVEREVIICTEYGGFGDNGVVDFLRTPWDDAVDKKSLCKKVFTFEKYFSGKYMGDLVRETLVTLAEKGLFCQGASKQLNTHHFFKSSTVSKIEADTLTGRTDNTECALRELGLQYTKDDIKILQYVCAIISYRGVQLVSLITALLINRMDRSHCTVAIDGSLYEKHPRFKPLMEHFIAKDVGTKPFSLILAKDGSGKGAALVAAVEDRLSIRYSKY